MVVVAVHRWAN